MEVILSALFVVIAMLTVALVISYALLVMQLLRCNKPKPCPDEEPPVVEPVGPPRPQALTILEIQEDGMSQYLYTFKLPALGAADVVARELHVTINGEAAMHELAIDLTEYKLTLEEDSNVSMYLIDIDDAGNRSAMGAMLEFVVIDTVPPNAPTSPEIIGVEEVVMEEPVVEEPVAEEPVVEEPVAEEPVVEEPVAEEPVAEEPVVEEPVAEEPVVEEPVVEEPVAEEPVVEEPVAEEPVAEEPVVEEPVAEEPVVEEPVAEEPVVEEPVAEEPVAEEPTDETPSA